MNYRKIFVGMLFAMSAIYVYAEGDPEFVKFPTGYDASYTNYATMNRAGKDLVAKMYANDIAISSYEKGRTAASGSIIVMEVYKTKKDASDKPIVGNNGVYEIDKLAAVAVMERRDDWEEAYTSEHRLVDWGFAIYNPDGTQKSNDLACVQCHTPQKSVDYLFSYIPLIEYVKPDWFTSFK
jgi:cytochrome P460